MFFPLHEAALPNVRADDVGSQCRGASDQVGLALVATFHEAGHVAEQEQPCGFDLQNQVGEKWTPISLAGRV